MLQIRGWGSVSPFDGFRMMACVLNEWLKKSAGLILIILRLGMHSTLPELHCSLDQNLLTEVSARVARNRVTDWGLGFQSLLSMAFG